METEIHLGEKIQIIKSDRGQTSDAFLPTILMAEFHVPGANLFRFLKNLVCYGRTDRLTHPLTEMRGRT